jgi:hypothetical protein
VGGGDEEEMLSSLSSLLDFAAELFLLRKPVM